MLDSFAGCGILSPHQTERRVVPCSIICKLKKSIGKNCFPTRCVLCRIGASTRLKKRLKIHRNFLRLFSFLCNITPRFCGSGFTLFTIIAPALKLMLDSFARPAILSPHQTDRETKKCATYSMQYSKLLSQLLWADAFYLLHSIQF